MWFLDSPQFAHWMAEPKGTLFCPGIPGAGKTMMAAIAVDHLVRKIHGIGTEVAYLYCSYKSKEVQNVSSQLEAILKQVTQARPSLIATVDELHHQHAGRGTRPFVNELSMALESILENIPVLYVVVDALDEFLDNGMRHQFIAKLCDLQKAAHLRFMVTSRFIPDITAQFREAPILEIRASDEDVRKFIAGQSDRLPKCIQDDAELQAMVQERIVRAVDGM